MNIERLIVLKRYLFGLVVAVALFAMSTSAIAQKDANGRQLQVGDEIEFEFHGKKQRSEILEFTKTGWPTVEVEFGAKTIKWFFPADQATLVAVEQEVSEEHKHSESGMRVWTDASGKYAVMAELLSLQGGKVKLRKGDGKVVGLNVDRLSQKDREYLKQLGTSDEDEENPFAGGINTAEKTEIPDDEGEPGFRGSGRRDERIRAGSNRTIPRINNSIVLRDTPWKFEPDPVRDDQSGSASINFSTMMKEHEFHNDYVAQPSTNGKFIAVCISNPFEVESELVVISLENGKSGRPVPIAVKEAELIAVADDGKTVVTLAETRGRESGSLVFWDLSGQAARQTAEWAVKGFHDRRGFEPRYGWFVGPAQLLTFGRQIALWDCDAAESIYSIDVGHNTRPALSPGGNQFAFQDGAAIYLARVKDGGLLGSLECGEEFDRLSFSASGQLLAGMKQSTGEICVWDLVSQDVVRQFAAPGGAASSLQWCGDRFILVDDTHLMDVELRATVWKYSVAGGELVGGHNGRFWFVGDARLTPIQIPHRKLDDDIARFDPDQLLLIKPGAEVSIVLETDFAPSQERKIREDLANALNSIDVNVVENAVLQVVAKVKKLKKEKVSVSSFFDHFNRNAEEISYTPSLATIEIMKSGTKLWGKSRRFGPLGVIHVKQNETTQGAANRLSRPDPDFFTKMRFPPYIAEMPDGKPLGDSEISSRGVR